MNRPRKAPFAATRKIIGSKNNKRRNGQPLIDPGLAFTTPTQTYLTVSGATAAAALSNQNNLSSAGGLSSKWWQWPNMANATAIALVEMGATVQWRSPGQSLAQQPNAPAQAVPAVRRQVVARHAVLGPASEQKPQQRRRRKAPAA